MLLWFVVIYWIISVAIGLIAALKVRNATDFAAAGHSLPMYMVTATVFATWFGAEAVLGAPATFLKEGLSGVVADPFGSSLCLVLVGLFFAKPLYRKKFLTIGDFYHEKYGRTVEIMVTLCIIVSYLGWVAAQIMALGLVFNVVSDGVVSRQVGMLIGSGSVLIYTIFGGMWAVAITDFLHMIIIVVGMLFIGNELSGMTGGVLAVAHHAQDAGLFKFWPEFNFVSIAGFVAALFTMMLGSIPQQDVFQRVTSSKNEKIAVRSAILGGVLYFCFAFVPMFLAYSATLIDPKLVQAYLNTDSQMILPIMIMRHTLLSAIKSCASATLLAPSVSFSENIVKGFFKHLTQKQLLLVMRMTVIAFTGVVTLFALNSQLSIFKMVENAYKITLVAAFIPLVFGIYWSKAKPMGGLLSMVMGIATWLILEMTAPDAVVAPQLAGLIASLLGMLVGSLLIPAQMLKTARQLD